MGLSGLYTRSQELFPTELRGIGIGFCTCFALMTAIISPLFLSYLDRIGGSEAALHFVALCLLCCGFLSFLLRETRYIHNLDEDQ